MLTRDMFAVANLLVVIDVVDKTLFRTKSIDSQRLSIFFFGAVLPSVLVLRKADKLALTYQCLENAFCTYCRSI